MLRLLSDSTKLRILLLLSRKELCVCQIMAVLGVSQSLISHNLKMMRDAGLLSERRQGKLIFYSVSKQISAPSRRIISSLSEALRTDRILTEDLSWLMKCEELRTRTGRCDMKTFAGFMAERHKRTGAVARRITQ